MCVFLFFFVVEENTILEMSGITKLIVVTYYNISIIIINISTFMLIFSLKQALLCHYGRNTENILAYMRGPSNIVSDKEESELQG